MKGKNGGLTQTERTHLVDHAENARRNSLSNGRETKSQHNLLVFASLHELSYV